MSAHYSDLLRLNNPALFYASQNTRTFIEHTDVFLYLASFHPYIVADFSKQLVSASAVQSIYK